MDASSVAAAIGAANAAATLISSAVAAMKQLRERLAKDPEIIAAFAELTQKLADAAVDTATVKGKLIELQAQVVALENRESLLSRRVTRDGVYYLNGPPQGYSEGPYCTGCWDSSSKVAMLRRRTEAEAPFGAWRICPVCDEHYPLPVPPPKTAST